jgi:hypothetical protein
VCTYDRHQLVLDPAHQDAALKIKRKAFHSTPGGRLEQAVPESKIFLELAENAFCVHFQTASRLHSGVKAIGKHPG